MGIHTENLKPVLLNQLRASGCAKKISTSHEIDSFLFFNLSNSYMQGLQRLCKTDVRNNNKNNDSQRGYFS